MAFIGDIELPTGVSVNYHVIQSYKWNKWDHIEVIVDCYLNQECRQNGKQPMYRQGFEVSIGENDPRMEITLPYLYQRLALMHPFINMQADV